MMLPALWMLLLSTLAHGADPFDAPVVFSGARPVVGDTNGDGYADLLAGMPAVCHEPGCSTANQVSSATFVYYGGPDGLPTFASWAYHEDGFGFGVAVGAGDVNGDSYDELIIGAADDLLSGAGAVSLFYGNPDGFGGTPLTPDDPGWTVTGATGDDELGASLVVADLDLDGLADLVVAAPGAGAVQLYFGDPTIPRLGDALVGGIDFGGSVAVGDVDGDGYPDLLVGSRKGRVQMFPGGPAGPAATATWEVSDPGYLTVGDQLATGDVNGDGYDDLMVGGPGLLALFFGGPGGPSTVPDWEQRDAGPNLYTVFALGDADGDGFADLAYPEGGELHLLWGAADGLVDSGWTSPIPILDDLAFGDLNSDGGADLLAGTSNELSVFYTICPSLHPDVDGDGVGARGDPLRTCGAVEGYAPGDDDPCPLDPDDDADADGACADVDPCPLDPDDDADADGACADAAPAETDAPDDAKPDDPGGCATGGAPVSGAALALLGLLTLTRRR